MSPHLRNAYTCPVTTYSRWQDIRAEYVEAAGGEEAVAAGKKELLAQQPTEARSESAASGPADYSGLTTPDLPL